MSRFTLGIKALLFMITAFFTSQDLSASHLYGGYTSYECIGPCQVRVHARTYRDCSGANNVLLNTTTFLPTVPGCDSMVALNAWTLPTVVDYVPVCPTATTRCYDPQSPIIGFQENHIWRDYSYCGLQNTCAHALTWNTCCRNPSVTNLALPGGDYVSVTSIFDNSLANCNSSPVFPRQHALYICSNQAAEMALGGYDADGDSIVYLLDSCRGLNDVPLNYQAGYTPTAPMGPGWTVSLDPVTGNLRLVPNPGNPEVATICVRWNEYRNGALIGTGIRDIQVSNYACPNNTMPAFSAYTNISPGAVLIQDIFTINNCQSLSFDIGGTDPNVGQTLKMYWDGNIAGASFSEAGQPQNVDTVSGAAPVGHFEFTPSQPGSYSFELVLEDDACPLMGRINRIIRVEVTGQPTVSAQATQVSCLGVNFTSNVCALPNITYAWSGAGGLSGTTANLSHQYPGPGTYPWQLIVSQAGTPLDTILDTLVLNPVYTPLIAPASPVVICQGNTQLLTAGGGYASYLWNTGAITPSITVNQAGTYHLSVTDAQGCQYVDSVEVQTQGLTYQPLITGLDTLDKCLVDSIALSVGPYSWYFWSTGATTASIDVTTGGTYHVTVEDAGGCQYADSLVVTEVRGEISGTIWDHLINPLQNQKVYLIRYDSANISLHAVDSTFTDGSGWYQFCGVTEPIVYVKAAPDSAAYPQDMPTYAMGALFWNNANDYPINAAPHTVNFATLQGTNPGGPGFIGGLISQGANRMAAGGPVAGLTVVLYNVTANQPVAITKTDINGYFSFGNIPLGSYEIRPDQPLIDNTQGPDIQLTAGNPVQDSLAMSLYETYLGWPGAVAIDQQQLSQVEVVPSPFGDRLRIHGLPVLNEAVQATLVDLQGRTVASWELGSQVAVLSTGLESLKPGIYFFRMQVGSAILVRKLIKE